MVIEPRDAVCGDCELLRPEAGPGCVEIFTPASSCSKFIDKSKKARTQAMEKKKTREGHAMEEERKNQIARIFFRYILLGVYRKKEDVNEIIKEMFDTADDVLIKMLDEGNLSLEELKLLAFEEIMKLREGR